MSEPAEEVRSAKRGLVLFFASLSVIVLGGVAVGFRAIGFFPHFLIVEVVVVLVVCLSLDKRARNMRWQPEGDLVVARPITWK